MKIVSKKMQKPAKQTEYFYHTEKIIPKSIKIGE